MSPMSVSVTEEAAVERRRDPQWALTLLSVLPLILLVGRIWLTSKGDPQTMLLLIQHLTPAGLVILVLSSLVWMAPIMVVSGRMLEAYRLISIPNDAAGAAPWPFRFGGHFPNWLVCAAACFATVTWQLQYLPTLGAMLMIIVALGIRQSYPDHRGLILATSLALPGLALLLQLLLLGPAVKSAWGQDQYVTALLLGLPPLLTIFLTGPVPAFAARLATLLPAITILILVPLLATTSYLRTPLVPLVAVEVITEGNDEPFPPVMVGYVIAAEDHVVTIMQPGGSVIFVRSDRVTGQTMCPAGQREAESDVALIGWAVNRSLLNQFLPQPTDEDPDRRCQGRERRAGR